MAELLIVVAIIAVLSGVTFIAVQTYQRSLAQLERNTIAKELFFAAQNHLTMAESQGYLGVTNDGKTSTLSEDQGKEVYYIVSNGTPAAGSMLDLMLPFGSIDETVRSGGSYLIRYQTNPATVLDVFYCSRNGTPGKFNHSISEGEYSRFLGYRNNLPGSDYVVGWYGGGDAADAGIYLEAPTVEITNAERLTVTVTDPNYNKAKVAPNGTSSIFPTTLEIIISGETKDDSTQAKAVIVLRNPEISGFTPNGRVVTDNSGSYTITLDDITAAAPTLGGDGLHFADLNQYASGSDNKIWFMSDPVTGTTQFRPGEDITVEAVVFSNSELTNIAYSSAKMANSLFADSIEEDALTTDHSSVRIADFRHLENLDQDVSGLDTADFTIAEAMQTEDLVWASATDAEAFTAKIAAAKSDYATADAVKVYKQGETAANGTAPGCYLPINPDYALTYDGMYTDTADGGTEEVKSRRITGVKVGASADAPYDGAGGLFGAPTDALTVKNLALVDFSVNASGDAGAQAGKLPEDSSISNVIAYHTSGNTTAAVTSTGGSAGGLIGSMTGTAVTKSAAALVVTGSTNAGGLVGASTGDSSITASYAGGHTTNGQYATDSYNVTATGTASKAGGLVGSAGDAKISQSYSTCSVSGATAGGFVGTITGEASECYCTGKVTGTTRGAFAGSTGTFTDCLYYAIINEENNAGVISYLAPVPGSTDATGVSALDDTAASFNEFYGPITTGGTAIDWLPAKAASAAMTDYFDDTLSTAYDPTLAKAYGDCYALRTVAQLGATINEAATSGLSAAPKDFVATHYGDWPLPETYVLNTGTGVGSNGSLNTDGSPF